MIHIHDHLINPLHVAAISPTIEASALDASSSSSFMVVLSGGNEIIFRFDSDRAAQHELSRIQELVDQASRRR